MTAAKWADIIHRAVFNCEENYVHDVPVINGQLEERKTRWRIRGLVTTTSSKRNDETLGGLVVVFGETHPSSWAVREGGKPSGDDAASSTENSHGVDVECVFSISERSLSLVSSFLFLFLPSNSIVALSLSTCLASCPRQLLTRPPVFLLPIFTRHLQTHIHTKKKGKKALIDADRAQIITI